MLRYNLWCQDLKLALLLIVSLLVFCGSASAICTSIACPTNITVSNQVNQCGAVVNYSSPIVSGSFPCFSFSTVCAPPSGSFFPKGSTSVTCTNNVSCSFSVTVVDTQPPSITCPTNIALGIPAHLNSFDVNFPAPTTTDNCPAAGPTTCNPASGSTFFASQGTPTNDTCSVFDTSGNSATCSFNVALIQIPTPTPHPTVTPRAPIQPNAAATPIAPGPVCSRGLKIKKAKLSIRNLDKTFGSQGLSMSGSVSLNQANISAFNTAANGAQLLIEDSNSVIYELSSRSVPIPSGAPGAGCHPSDGWQAESYTNQSNALQNAGCTNGSANGLQSLSFITPNGKPNERNFNLEVNNARILKPTAEGVKALLVFGATNNFGSGGQCATASFSAKQCKRRKGNFTCAQKASANKQ